MHKNILNQIVTNNNFAWDSSLSERPEEFVVKLSKKSLIELHNNKDKLKEKKIKNFPSLIQNIILFKKNKIINGPGLFVIEGVSFVSFSSTEIKDIYLLISMILGELLEQDSKGSKLITVKNIGKSLSTGGRYHQTRDGGSFHTDGPHWNEPPDILGLLCINPAFEGGVSKFISVYTIHNIILQLGIDVLEPLYNDFFFDRREEVSADLRTISKPIFSFQDNKLNCRFLKDYIISGSKIKDVDLSTSQNISINVLEKTTKDSNNALNYNLKNNDMVFSHNHRLFHGRTSFKDSEEIGKERELLRVWIKTNLN
jgi:hypothetical protein